MSQKKIWSYTLPTSLVLILLFQNCSGGSFDVKNPAMTSNFGSSAPAPGNGSTGGGTSPVDTVPGAPGTPGSPANPPSGNLPPDPSDAGRRILKVCASGCTYATLGAAVAAAQDNDIIEAAGGNYNECLNINQNGIKLRGVNGRPHLTGAICGGKGEINISGQNTVIESFEFSGMANPDNNGAGIRHQGIGLTVRNSYFHDGQEGILSGAPNPNTDADSILVENSRFEHLGGGGGYAHAVYFGAHRQVTIRNSLFLASQDQGHEFKSRAQNTMINCSEFASLGGVDSYSVNFPDGGNVAITNSLIEQGTASSNSGVIDYGSEHPAQWPVQQFNLTNVTVINDAGGGALFQVAGPSQFTVNDSVVVGPGTMFSNSAGTLNNTKSWPTRADAGFGAYPNLPTPVGCGAIGLSF